RAIHAAWRSDGHGLVGEVPRDVSLELIGAVIAQLAVALHCLEHDPVEILPKIARQRRRIRPSRRSAAALLVRGEWRETLARPLDVALLLRGRQRGTGRTEGIAASPDPETPRVANREERRARHAVHPEVRKSGLAYRRLKHARHVPVLHERQRLALGGKASREELGVHA